MECELSAAKKKSMVSSIVADGYEKVYDEPWKKRFNGAGESYNVEVWKLKDHLYFFFHCKGGAGRDFVKVFTCMASDASAKSSMESQINFGDYSRGMIFSELLAENFNPDLVKDLLSTENYFDANEVLLMIEKCKTLKNYMKVLRLQEELLLKHFFSLQESFDHIKEKSEEKLFEYKQCKKELEGMLSTPLPENLDLKNLSKLLKGEKLLETV